MRLFLENVYDLFSNLKKGAGITFDSDGSKLIIISYGKPKVILGSFPMATEEPNSKVDQKVKEVVEETFENMKKLEENLE